MSLLRKIMRPILDERELVGIEKGEARGEARGSERTAAEYEAWIQRQIAAGVTFADDIPKPTRASNRKPEETHR